MPCLVISEKVSFIYDEYRQRTLYLSSRKDIHVLDMSSEAADVDFWDDAHPTESAGTLWTDRLASFIEQNVLSRSASGKSFGPSPLRSEPRTSTGSNARVAS